jgi:hypothetical protein
MVLGISFGLNLDLTLQAMLFWRTATSNFGRNSAYSMFERMILAN